MLFLFKSLSHLPLGLLHGLGWALGWLAFLLSPTYRRRFLGNAAQAGLRFGQVRAAVGHAGRMVAELPRLWFGPAPRVQWGDTTPIESAFAAGRGVIFLTPHMGCFEVTAQAQAARHAAAHGPLTVLYRPARKPWLARVIDNARARPGLRAVPTTMAGVRQMVRALQQGQAVGMLPDQVPPAGMGEWLPFFGRPAYTMTLAARLAVQTGATVVLAWGERLPWGRGFRIHLRGLAEPLPTDTVMATKRLNQEMERIILECPQQYLWGYARYKPARSGG